MRNDSVGFFWNDTPPPKPPKAEKLRRIPPSPTWLDSSYLPGLEEARRFPVALMTTEDLIQAYINKEELIFDVETYRNYWLVCFTSVQTGKVIYLEMRRGESLDVRQLTWILTSFTVIGFNSANYDLTICNLAAAGLTTDQLKECSDEIIQENARGSDLMRRYKWKALKVDHIDLIEVAPLQASLKTYAGRMHCRKMQDLPFHPSTELSDDQITITRWYCVNDITNTQDLRECLREHIDLRVALSNEYRVDLRSKSDAQIAEAVIGAELARILGARPKRPEIPPGTAYKFRVPDFIKFETPLMNWALDVIRRADFIVEETGSIAMPEEIKSLNLQIAHSIYQMGIGGLHSTESTIAHHTDENFILIDKDVTSYYPFIILNQSLFPKHLGPAFLQVFGGIVKRRVAAKDRGDKVTADSLKIVVNGTFGKLSSKWSIFYAPNLLIQTTVTGQLSLLMLIERLELAGINVVSANTDGIVIKVPRDRHAQFDAIIEQWERDTNFNTEETRYMSLYSKDVNNYIAVKQAWDKATKSWIEKPDGAKAKGAYANPWNGSKNLADRLHKNPTTTICVEAVEKFLTEGVPVDHTIRASTDIKKFITVRSVKGGAVKVWESLLPPHSDDQELVRMAGFNPWYGDSWLKSGETDRSATTFEGALARAKSELSVPGRADYLGKSVRWYYGKDVEGEMVYALSGNRVPRSEGAVALMELNDNFPEDIDHDWYIGECTNILEKIGAIEPLAA